MRRWLSCVLLVFGASCSHEATPVTPTPLPSALPTPTLLTQVTRGGYVVFFRHAARDAAGAIHYAGGLGWRFGDPGSGYDLGRRAITRALLELQGWLPPSRLPPGGLKQARVLSWLHTWRPP